MTRRDLLWLAGSGLIAAPAFGTSEPRNLSYPLRTIEGSVTAPDFLFVRDHFNEPEIPLAGWKLRVEGRVEHPYELGFDDLVELPGRKVEAVLECAGNAAGGSAVSSGTWEGVSMAALLEVAQPAPDAAFVLLEGADSGRLFGDSPTLPYSQLVPLSKCQDQSSLVAFKYNDLALPKRNGFPARAIFPGWYGMNSVKWLRRISVVLEGDRQTAFHQSGMNRLYNRVVREAGDDRVKRVSTIEVKSVLAWPASGLNLPSGKHLVWGFAWSGKGTVREVAVSADGGRSWDSAKLDSTSNGYAWVRWSYSWNAKPGSYVLMSSAADSTGQKQPRERDPARKDAYELNWCVPVHCNVR